MPVPVRKIINDPVHGFITIDHPLIFQVVSHPWFQRLRRIHQMAFAHLVYPGAVHSRLHHALGAYHLMGEALNELRAKGVEITEDEAIASRAAILLHDIGHGPFSHALEHVLIPGVEHESISLLIMKIMNEQMGGELQLAIDIFTNNYPKKPFLHQLISGQLDVDRMDYLSRDSFFTGVAEGVIGYDRIIKMLTVHNGQLMVEEKAIYSIEKFLVSRRLMYWQVYLHKTALSAEKTLVRVVERARELQERSIPLYSGSPLLEFFLSQPADFPFEEHIATFCKLDDYDLLSAIKNWTSHADPILSLLCQALVDRKLLKVKLQAGPFEGSYIDSLREKICAALSITKEESRYFLFEGQAINTTYDTREEMIQILFKDGKVRDISQVDNALIQQSLASTVKKHYICYYNIGASDKGHS